MAERELITAEELRRILSYDAQTGIFTWIEVRCLKQRGSIAGKKHNRGYWNIRIGGRNGNLYLAHRLAWLYMTGKWPENQIDHINGIRNDNRWGNLREATSNQNNQNGPTRRNGLKWAYLLKGKKYSRPWLSKIVVNRKIIRLGVFSTEEEAHNAGCDAAKKYHGEFANTGG